MEMYFAAIVLPEELDKKVLAYKQYMNQYYKCSVGLKSPAHITIIPPFWMSAEKENELKQDIDELSAQVTKFNIETNNFSCFAPKTIFIAVKENSQLVHLKDKAVDLFKRRDYKIKFENRTFHPHITIATRDLFKKDFQEAWGYFKNKTFVEEWQTIGLSILRHNKKNWDVIYTSQFQ